MVFAVLRAGRGQEVPRLVARHAGFRVEHTHVAERHILQRVGPYPQGVARSEPKDRNSIGVRFDDIDFFTNFPESF